MRTVRVGILSLAGLTLLLIGSTGRAAEKFPLEEGDTWVFAGDSITAQKLHTNYIEAFCYARYPKMTFRFRNSGIGGDTIPKVIDRFGPDVAGWKPSIVSVELGMNDQGGSTTDKYIENMGKLTQLIQGLKARPIFITASPVNNGNSTAKFDGRDKKLNDFAIALKKFAAEQKAPYADQFHALVDVWAPNKEIELYVTNVNLIKTISKDDKLQGVEHLRKFLEAQKPPPPYVAMQGDPVHPGAPGQLMMAAAILKDLNAESFVSEAQLTLDGKVTLAKGCTIDNVKAENGVISFDRTDECLPFPIADEARPVLAFDPTIVGLSGYTLRVGSLKAEKYDIKVDGKALATVSAEELAKGLNLTRFAQGPIADQGKAILAAVSAKEGLVQTWRTQSKLASAATATPSDKEKLTDITKQVEAADAKIREAARAKKLHFEITPAKA
jgi:lysophospholipase L1-like esterase